jgi:hypothetical protein
MYVKVTAGAHPYGQRGDFLIEVEPPIHFDHIAAPLGENAQWDADHNLVSPGDIDFQKAIGADINYLHMLEFTADQTQYEANKEVVAFRYVWWASDKGIEAVVTTRRIFIVGENGKTIDRV